MSQYPRSYQQQPAVPPQQQNQPGGGTYAPNAASSSSTKRYEAQQQQESYVLPHQHQQHVTLQSQHRHHHHHEQEPQETQQADEPSYDYYPQYGTDSNVPNRGISLPSSTTPPRDSSAHSQDVSSQGEFPHSSDSDKDAPSDLTFSDEMIAEQVQEQGKALPPSTPACDRPSLPFMNEGHALQQCGEQWSFVAELLNDILTERDEMISALQAALQSNNHKQYRDIAHKVKGSALYLNLLSMVDTTVGAEMLGRGLEQTPNDPTLLSNRQAYIDRLVHEYEKLEQYIPIATEKAANEGDGGGDQFTYDDSGNYQ